MTRKCLTQDKTKEFEEMIRLEMAEAEETIERASEELKILLLPKDPNDEKERYYGNPRRYRR